jgi:hypothetical protein
MRITITFTAEALDLRLICILEGRALACACDYGKPFAASNRQNAVVPAISKASETFVGPDRQANAATALSRTLENGN